MKLTKSVVAAFMLHNFVWGVVVSPTVYPTRTTAVVERGNTADPVRVTCTAFAGLPDTNGFRAAMASAKYGVQSAVWNLTTARANPFDWHKIQHDTGGDRPEGINCEGEGWANDYMCTAIGLHGNVIPMMLNYTVLLDPRRVYCNKEPIICVKGEQGAFYAQDRFCLFMKDVPRNLKGYEIAVLLGLMWDHECEHCGHVPVRMIDDGINDPSHGWLVATPDIVDPGNCLGICGPGIAPMEPEQGHGSYLPHNWNTTTDGKESHKESSKHHHTHSGS